jgi:hypothetical protein
MTFFSVAEYGGKMSDKCETIFLPDKPAEKDEFGSHQTVVDSIVHIIRTQKGEKLIALLGGWGSGKSTIVELLEKRLKGENGNNQTADDNAVFIFDTWACGEDPIRYVLLRELIRYLKNIEWISAKDKEELDNRLTVVSAKKEESKRIEGPLTDFLETMLIISIALFTIGLKLFSDYVNFRLLTSALLNKHYEVFIVAIKEPMTFITIALLVLPFIVFAVGCILGKNLVSILFSKLRTVSETFVTKIEPNFKEFQRLFSDIMDRTANSSSRKLCIVIDNLDRIGRDKAKEDWTTLVNFISFDKEQKHKEWHENLWFIVPFDDIEIRELWDNDNEKKLSNHFVDKTFQISVHVPPLITSNWQVYFSNYMRKAIRNPIHTDAEFYQIYRLFQLKKTIENTIPTPREIKIFINKLAAVHIQRCTKNPNDSNYISLVSQALFVLYVDRIRSINVILDGSVFDEEIRRNYLNDEVLNDFLSLYLNVEKEMASQVLYQPKIESAFINGEYGIIEDVIDRIGFIEQTVIFLVNRRDEMIKNPITIAYSGLILKEIGKSIDIDIYSRSEMLRKLSSYLSRVASFNSLDEKSGIGLVYIINNAERKDETCTRVLSLISKMKFIWDEKDEEPVKEILEKWSIGVLYILKNIEDEKAILDNFSIPGKAKTYVEILRMVGARGEESAGLVKFLKPGTATEGEIFSYLSMLIVKAHVFTRSYADSVKLLINSGAFTEWSWGKLGDSLYGRLQGTNLDIDPEEIISCTDTLIFLSRHRIAGTEEKIVQLALQGHLLSHLKKAIESTNSLAVAICILVVFRFNPNGQHEPAIGNSKEGLHNYSPFIKDPKDIKQRSEGNDLKNVYDRFTDLYLEYYDIEYLLLKLIDFPKFISEILEQVIHKGNSTIITPQLTIDHYEVLEKNLDKGALDSHVSVLIDKTNFISLLAETGFKVGFIRLYIWILRTEKGKKEREYREGFLRTTLDGLSEEIWLEELKKYKESDIINLLLELAGQEIKLSISTNLIKALNTHAIGVLQKQIPFYNDMNDVETFKKILNSLDRSSINTLCRYIQDTMIANSKVSLEQIIMVYGNLLIDSKIVIEKEGIVRFIFLGILERQIKAEWVWLRSALNLVMKRVSKKEGFKDSIKAFKEAIQGMANRGSIADIIEPEFDDVAMRLGITSNMRRNNLD